MSENVDEQCPEDCEKCAKFGFLDLVFVVMYLAGAVAIGAAVYAFFWQATWTPFWVAAGAWFSIQMGPKCHIWFYKIWNFRLRRQLSRRDEEIRALQKEIAQKRQERIQVAILNSQLSAERAQLEAQISALRAECLAMERLLAQRKLEQEAREARRRLEIACAAIEADRLEAAAWRMELSAKQLELKLGQADLFESLSAIEDNAQDRIIAAYEQGFDHGQRGIVIPLKHLRHLRVVDESA